ncbi:signal peptidase II [Granulicella sp. WH15]|uniref:signal peptidase II n=1 Tax=Granulicella sp. WH15 TaxID=2602070 RepID=UPI001367323C|nr:signal peptidase II [Granulicella sp. WH15]QHN04086.1 signal peptidase II [Granulicella sp. WH15]
MSDTSFTTPDQQHRHRDARPMLLVLTVFILLLDRLTKLWVEHHILQSHWITVIPGVFRISHVLNTGAAFSLFAESMSSLVVRDILIGFSIVAVVVVLGLLWRAGRELSTTSVALTLILAGALGNLYDRIHYSYVIDFLAVKIYHYNWPDFNVADSAIVTGACLLLLEIFRGQPATQE